MKRNKTWMREKLGTWNITLENHRERGFFLFFIHIFHVFSFFHLKFELLSIKWIWVFNILGYIWFLENLRENIRKKK